jgi:hypothetical protein
VVLAAPCPGTYLSSSPRGPHFMELPLYIRNLACAYSAFLLPARIKAANPFASQVIEGP